MQIKNLKNIIKFTLIILTLLVLTIIDLNTGHIKIPSIQILKFFNFSSEISEDFLILIREFRFPRVFAAIISGAALSLSGLIMQTLFRNPLAGPYVLGVSSGASLGVAIVVLGTSTFIDIGGYSNFILLFAAGIGSAAVLALILSISFRVKDILSILIIGILISGVVNSIVSILQYYAVDINVKSYVVWTMGNLNAVAYNDIMILFPILFITIIIVYIKSKSLNLILPGENFAKTMGVNIINLRIIMFICVSILTGAVTAFCGPIGFIGIVAPHVARWIFNTSNHFILIPASIFLGSTFLLCGDLLTHLVASNGVLPINAITSILGAPFIIWIVIQNKRTIV